MTSGRAIRGSAARRAATAGFSLIELVAALGILAIMGGILFVDYSGVTTHERLKAASRKLTGYCEYVRAEAASRGRPCRLMLHLDLHKYRFIPDPPRDDVGRYLHPDNEVPMSADELADWDESFEWTELPRNVFFVALQISAKEQYEKGEVHITFWPDGYVDPFIIHMKTSADDLASVVMNGQTGAAEAVPDALVRFPSAESGDFNAVMGNRAPGTTANGQAPAAAGGASSKTPASPKAPSQKPTAPKR